MSNVGTIPPRDQFLEREAVGVDTLRTADDERSLTRVASAGRHAQESSFARRQRKRDRGN